MSKKIFITGIAGFLGSHLADEFIAQGHSVVGCDNLTGGYKENVPDKAEFHEVDCLDFDAINKLTKDVDVVYHTAAIATEGLSVFSPHLVTQHVFQNSMPAISNACNNGVKRFVFCSSMARYGENEIPFTEETPTNPIDPYGIAKVATEDVLKVMSEVHGMDYVIAVPHNIIGPRQKYDDPYRNVASIFINRMLQGKQPVIYGDGNQMRCFSFVQDCVQCLDKMAFQNDVVGHTINIGPDEEENFVTINKLAETIAEIMDFKLKPIFHDDRPQEVRLAHCSADKARKLLGYKTEWSLEKGLKKKVEWIKRRGPKEFDYLYPIEIINHKTPKTWKDRLL
ncbi:NAD-dependent epimerase/dehydratase family protein [Nanoarchaeota archaeon]